MLKLNNKKILVLHFILAISLVIGCKKHNLISEVPDKVTGTKVDSVVFEKIVAQFPESQNVTFDYPSLFTDTAKKEIVLTKESEVFVKFISEGAYYTNTLGWYTYTVGNEPKSSSDFKWEIAFPNISAKNSGGELVQGDMVQLGTQKFPAGTVIGFFLIIQGWQQDGTINYNNQVFFTNSNLNPNNEQHTILFKIKNSANLMLGFEDLLFTDPACDKDFNDVLIAITDNQNGYEPTSFDLSKVPNL